MAFFRAIGSSAFLVMEAVRAVVEGKIKLPASWLERFDPPWKRIKKVNAEAGVGKV